MKRTFTHLFGILIVCLLSFSAKGQTVDALRVALDHLKQEQSNQGLTDADISDYLLSSMYQSKKSGITHVYLNQAYQDIQVERANANANISRDGQLLNMYIRFIPDLESRITNATASLQAEDAVRAMAEKLELALPVFLNPIQPEEGPARSVSFDQEGFALEPIKARLIYFPTPEDGVRLCWEVLFYERGAEHHWNVLVDAANGKIWSKRDMVLHCSFGPAQHTHESSCLGYDNRSFSKALQHSPFMEEEVLGGTYRVLPVPVESPNHGDFANVTDPEDPIASPYGWHDVDGADGADYTVTRGNNVHAYQDTLDLDDTSNDEPDGGADLQFSFPYNPSDPPQGYQQAAVVNLFYWCNIMHDVWYQYGFDEPSGNFQFNNYGNGGEEGDYIRAEAQDGSGTNNANFSSSADGSNARIQMYLWTGGGTIEDLVTVNSPDTLAGSYGAVEAGFGPGLPTDVPITAELVLVDDGGVVPSEGCDAFINGAALIGKIALIDRGNCNFSTKVQNAQNSGAVAAIVCNNNNGDPISMGGGGGGGITIPSVMMYKADCDTIKTQLSEGVEVSLLGFGSTASFLDGDFDNGIICHEYGHGVSIRLTGGPGQGGTCLSNDEQMGEGWSDWVGIMLTMEEGDTGADKRGVGTFALAQPIDGDGIRPAPYSTDPAINDFTYAATNMPSISQPHGIGFVWCSMLWDLNWALIDLYGFDSDFYNGSGGNNIAMQLVTEGMKLQPCNPGFVDGRDAILLADEQLYDGVHQCLIWEVFAKRGLGKSASQGSSFDRFDQEEAFDLPNICLTPITPPSSAFSVDVTESCTGVFAFTDSSTDIPQAWLWAFGDGNSSTEESPVHTYQEEGTFVVELVVTNSLGSDTSSVTVVVEYPEPPVSAGGASVCPGTSATLSATTTSDQVNWYENGDLLFSGSNFTTPPIDATTTFMISSELKQPVLPVGPPDNNFGTGGYHNTGFTGTVLFEAHKAFVLESALVDAGSDGERLIELFDAQGNVISSVNVFAPAGPSTVTLNLVIPAPGIYSVGGTMIDLYRNDSGAAYPYDIQGLVTLTGSPAGPEYYYYLYDWKVREASCFSEQVPVTVEVKDAPSASFVINQTGALIDFTDASNDAVSWTWNFGDGSTSTDQNPSHLYTEDGTYTVSLTVSNGECLDSFFLTVEVTNVGVEDIEGLEVFTISPNPGNGNLRLYLEMQESKALQLKIINTLGQPVFRLQQETDMLEKDIDLAHLASGTYFVVLEVDGQLTFRKYVLMR